VNKTAIALIVLCLTVAGVAAAGLLDPRDNTLETFAKGFGMLGMLLLALSVARDARRAETQAGD
jgi:hypothetical protein